MTDSYHYSLELGVQDITRTLISDDTILEKIHLNLKEIWIVNMMTKDYYGIYKREPIARASVRSL